MAGADTRNEEDDLAEAREDYEHCVDRWAENYNAGLDDFTFSRLHEHWPERLRKERELQGQPCLVIPALPPLIRQVVNDSRQNKPSITVHPVDSAADPETAEIFNGLIRHIEQSSDADVAYDTAVEHSVTGGFGWFKINTRYATDDSFEQDIVIEAVPNCFAILPDPDSTAADSSDWMKAFEIESLTKRTFAQRWPDADPVSFDSSSTARKAADDGESVQVAYRWCREETSRRIVALSAPRADAPDDALAMAGNLIPENLVIDLAIYEAHRDLFEALGMTIQGRPRDVPSFRVYQKTYSGADRLEEIEWAGRWIPIVPVYGEDLNIEGRRILSGLVRPAKDAQRRLDYWESMVTELVALQPKSPFVGPVGAFRTDAARWATANVENHPFLEFDVKTEDGQAIPAAPQRQPPASVPAGALQLLLNASDDIKRITGIYDASLGARSNETSGKAIMARQREGDVGTFHYIDNLSRAIRHAGRIILDLVPKVYGTPRILRILGPEGDVSTVKVNQETPVQRKNPRTGELEEIMRTFDLSVGKYDLTVSAGPSFTSRREEAAAQMTELIRAYPAAAPIIGDLLAKNLDWPGASEIAERFKAMLPAQLQGQNPEAQAAQQQLAQLAQALQAAHAQIEQLKTDRASEARKLDIDAYEAETGRLKTIIPKGAPYDQAQMAPVVVASLVQILQSPDVLEAVASGADPQQIAAMIAPQPVQQPDAAAA